MAQPAPVPLPPELEQRSRQQRQRAWFVRDVRDERIGELRVDTQTGPERGPSIARRSSSGPMGPTSTWFAASRPASSV